MRVSQRQGNDGEDTLGEEEQERERESESDGAQTPIDLRGAIEALLVGAPPPPPPPLLLPSLELGLPPLLPPVARLMARDARKRPNMGALLGRGAVPVAG